jgi:hypothetical protein
MEKIEKFLKNFDFSLWGKSDFIFSLMKSICFLNVVLFINYHAAIIATKNSGPALNDLLFKYLPYVDTSFVDKYVSYTISYTVAILVIFYSRKAVLLLNSVSLLVLVRAFFINLTHLGVPQGITPTTSFFTQGGDLFFSGHTALPFLAALVFWEHRWLRYFFLAVSFFMALEVLLGRYHYSIDVFAAPFITYVVFVFVKWVSELKQSDILKAI